MRALWLLATPPAFEPRPPHAAAERFRVEPARGIVPLADVYLPDTPGPHPSVLIVHGGGFVIGSRRMKPVRYLATRLSAAGYAAAAFDYRMIFRGGRLDESLSDLATMSAWWRSQAARFHLDLDRISLAGFSAGATLMLLHAAENGTDRYERLVSFYGVYDFSYLSGRLAEWMRLLLLRSGDHVIWAERSPLQRCGMAAPLLLIHGTADTLVPVEHARRLQRRREELGLPVTLCEHDGLPHGFVNDARLPATDAAIQEMLGFLGPRRLLGSAAPGAGV